MSTALNWVTAYLGLGSNLDNPSQQILSAVREIATLHGVKEIALSPLYQTQPVGPQDQPDYINAVLRIETKLPPLKLLKQCQAIENRHGRVRLVHWGARTLDVDILLYGDQIIDFADLSIPHPELAKRAFVLYPLADVAPSDLLVPGKSNLSDLLAACPSSGIFRIES